MRLKVIACKVLERELSLLLARHENFIDVTYLRQGLHNEPQKLQETLQAEIDRIDSGDCLYTCDTKDMCGDFDAILLGYGLCSNGIVGLSSKKYKLIVPKAHDCITLFLGSKEKYKEYFDSMDGGIYWYTPGWIENTIMPSQQRYDVIYKHYEELYGEDNAEYLMEMEQGWLKEYKVCTYVNWKELPFPRHIDYTRQCSDYLGWKFDILEGDISLMQRFVDGNWNEEDFAIIQPGQKVEPSFDENVIK